MNIKNIEVLVGGFLLSGIISLCFLALHAADLGVVRPNNTYALIARFDNIGGLKPRAPVRTAGVTVGRVTAIELDSRAFQGVVTMDIQSEYLFPKDTSARILTTGLLGDQFLSLEPGGGDSDLEAGDVIAHTQSVIILENLIGQFLTSQVDRAALPPSPGNGK